MSRRIEIELTSARPDGSWTWRAAGAREPKGVVAGGLLHEAAKPGDVLRAEADFEIDGIVIVSVAAPKADNRPQPSRIELIGPSRPEGPGVTTQLVGRRSGGRGQERSEGDERRSRPQDGRARRDGDPGRRERNPRRPGPAGAAPGERLTGERRGSGPRDGRGPRPGAGDRTGGDRAGGSRTGGSRTGGSRPAGEQRGGPAPERRSRPPRLNPGSAHRKAVMGSLPSEQQAVAEHLLRGGIPAVRTALHLEKEKAEAEGRTAPNSEELLALAESLLPRLRAAEWLDRAEAAVAALDTLSMRDLRSVVAGADVARDEESRSLGSTLRQALETRLAQLHQDWASEITAQLDAGRVVRAVRLSARGPDPSARLDPELVARVADAAGATLSPETPPELWQSLLEAVVDSPVRRAVVPAGLPADAPAELKRAAHQASGSIPALAKILGVTIPPPPTGTRRRPPARSDRPTPPG